MVENTVDTASFSSVLNLAGSLLVPSNKEKKGQIGRDSFAVSSFFSSKSRSDSIPYALWCSLDGKVRHVL